MQHNGRNRQMAAVCAFGHIRSLTCHEAAPLKPSRPVRFKACPFRRSGSPWLTTAFTPIISDRNLKITTISTIFNIEWALHSLTQSDLSSILIRVTPTATSDPRASGIRCYERYQRLLSQDRCFALREAVLYGGGNPSTRRDSGWVPGRAADGR